MQTEIKITGAKVHNLKNISLTIPRNALVVFTGLSGSGKSSLAFDTIYAEGQRRYMESLSAYARQFLHQLDKPDVDHIEGLSPAISIDQKAASHNPRSTVATITEIYDYFRLLFANIGKPHCPICDAEIKSQSVQEIVDQITSWPKNTQILLLAPCISEKKGTHKELLDQLNKDGFTRVRINGEIKRLSEPIILDKNNKHTLEIVVDRLSITDENQSRLSESIETCLRYTEGTIKVENTDTGTQQLFSEHLACPNGHMSYAEISHRLFSFNSPVGACTECKGLGDSLDFDVDLVRKNASNLKRFLFVRHIGDNIDSLIAALRRRYHQTESEKVRLFFRNYMTSKPCDTCQGQRLKPEVLAIRIADKNIAQLTHLSVRDLIPFFQTLKLTEKEQQISNQILKEITARLSFLNNVGLNYLTLSRRSGSLSGGEYQRIRLATQIGAGLTGVLYVLDEPSIGLHQRDNLRLIETLIRLRDLGNTLIVVEHDEDTIQKADYVVDIGPGAGKAGGNVVFAGTVPELLTDPNSITGAYLTGKKKIEIPKKRRHITPEKAIKITGARENNLKNIDVIFPLSVLTAITGVSGSGKSTLIHDILHKGIMRHFHNSKERPGLHDDIQGLDHIDKLITIDQSPIGRTPRSNPVTYTDAFTPIRDLFAQTNEAKIRGFKPGRFSFNVKGGRCEACEGDGLIKIEMHFLSDVYVTCDVCKGKRYNPETLTVKFKGHTIADVLNMTVTEALELFTNIPQIKNKLKTIQEVGLGYIQLGQNATTLSGGEAQRIKLAKELSKRSTGKTLYLLDEPTTGLHFEDIRKLLEVLNKLVDTGNTIIVIEHNLDVIKTADHIIDLGPDGGDAGGQLIAQGTPEQIAKVKTSYTGQFLKNLLR